MRWPTPKATGAKREAAAKFLAGVGEVPEHRHVFRHGNLEDLSTRRHTANHVPCLLIGPREARRRFADELYDLTGVAPAIWRALNEK